MPDRESTEQSFARKNREKEIQRIQELSEDSGGLGPGDIVQIAREEAAQRQREFEESDRRYD